MRPLPAVVELVSGELVAGAEAPAAALTGEGFLPSQPNVPHPPPKKNQNIHCTALSLKHQRWTCTYQSRVFAKMSLELPRLTEFSFTVQKSANVALLTL